MPPVRLQVWVGRLRVRARRLMRSVAGTLESPATRGACASGCFVGRAFQVLSALLSESGPGKPLAHGMQTTQSPLSSERDSDRDSGSRPSALRRSPESRGRGSASESSVTRINQTRPGPDGRALVRSVGRSSEAPCRAGSGMRDMIVTGTDHWPVHYNAPMSSESYLNFERKKHQNLQDMLSFVNERTDRK